jgi:hypothetical protein
MWDVTQRRLAVTDVSGKPISLTIKGQAVHDTSVTINTAAEKQYLTTFQINLFKVLRNVGNYQHCIIHHNTAVFDNKTVKTSDHRKSYFIWVLLL